MRRRLASIAYLTPATVLTALFFVVPLATMVWLSFFEHKGFQIGTDWTLVNYEAFFSKPYYLQALWNSLKLAAIVAVVSTVAAYPVAYILAFHATTRWQRLGIMICVLPFWTSYLVRSYSWLLALSANGVVADVAGVLGLPLDTGLANSPVATVIGFVHFFIMLLTLTIFASLVRIPRNYLKAAADLGARPLSTFIHVTLPLSLPGVVAGAMLAFVLTLGDYVTPQILGGSKELVLTQVIMLQVQRQGNFPMAGAINFIMMLISIAVTLLANRAINRAARA